MRFAEFFMLIPALYFILFLRSLLNTEAHLKGTLIGYSQTYIVDEGKLSIGSLGYIYFADWDQNRERDRKCKVLVMGE